MASKGTAREWTPSRIGAALTRSPDWCLRLQGTELTLFTPDQTLRVNVEVPNSYCVHRGVLWTDVTLDAGSRGKVKVDGFPNGEGDVLSHALGRVLEEKRVLDAIAFVQQQHQMIDACGRGSDWIARSTEHRYPGRCVRKLREIVQPSAELATNEIGHSVAGIAAGPGSLLLGELE